MKTLVTQKDPRLLLPAMFGFFAMLTFVLFVGMYALTFSIGVWVEIAIRVIFVFTGGLGFVIFSVCAKNTLVYFEIYGRHIEGQKYSKN